MDWKKLGTNVALAALAAFAAALEASRVFTGEVKPTTAIVIAAGYAAIRGAVGAFILFVQSRKDR